MMFALIIFVISPEPVTPQFTNTRALYLIHTSQIETHISRVSCQKGPTRHAYAWQIGPFWQDTLDIAVRRLVTWCPACSMSLSFTMTTLLNFKQNMAPSRGRRIAYTQGCLITFYWSIYTADTFKDFTVPERNSNVFQ